MKTILFLALLGLVAVVIYRIRNRRTAPKPIASKPPIPELQKLKDVANLVPPPPAKPVPRRHAQQIRPTRPVHDANGIRYYPNTDGTYRNTETDATVTWLMLYLLMNDSYRSQFVEPDGYTEGMTFEEATAISEPELQQLAEAREEQAAASESQNTSPVTETASISSQPEPVTEQESRSSDASTTSETQSSPPTETTPVVNETQPTNNDTSSSYSSDSTF